MHYEIETPEREKAVEMMKEREKRSEIKKEREKRKKVDQGIDKTKAFPPQWLDCDLRKIDVTVLGTFDIIMADPPWDSESGKKV